MGRHIRGAGLIAATFLLASAGEAPADDCSTLSDAGDAVALVRDDVAAARAAAETAGDVAGALASARDDASSADLQIAAATSPAALVMRQRKIHGKLAAASRSLAKAAKRPEKTAKVLKLLDRSDAALAVAADLVGQATEEAACGPGPGFVLGGALGAQSVFPQDNWWNLDVSGRAPTANSDAIIDFIGRAKPLHADFGTTFGIPYVVIDGAQGLTPLAFTYDSESDHGAPGHGTGYPIPAAAKTTAGFIEGGVAGGGNSGDRHLLLVDTTIGFLYEIYAARWNGSAWSAGSGAVFDLSSNGKRPDGWTSADAAGLAIFPGLVRADEVFVAGEIRHAIRFTVRATQGYIDPASHDATTGAGGNLRPPLGLRVRLKSSVDLTAMSVPARVVLTAMKKYGLILADNGSDWYVSGSPDARWDDERMHDDFATITGNDFEVVP